MDLVYIGDLLSYKTFEDWGFDRGYNEWLHQWIEPQWLSWLIFILREVPDDPSFFTYGKWATIQAMEDRIIKAARKELCKTTF